jgi:exosortase
VARRQRLWLAAIVATAWMAGWQQWHWLIKRANDGSDESWGIVALLTFVALLWRDQHDLRLPCPNLLGVTTILMTTAQCLGGRLPPIFTAALALLGIGWLMGGLLPPQRKRFPLLSLAVLVLPLSASLNFYLGYPLRRLCAGTAEPILSVLGWPVSAQGAALIWNGQSVLIDAPCAGIAMLWLGLYLASLFSYLQSASLIKNLFNLFAAVAIVLLANVLRNVLLFFKEAGIVPLPHWTHEVIGLLFFGLIVLALYHICLRNTPPLFQQGNTP